MTLQYDYMIFQLVKAGYSKSDAENMTYYEAVQVFCFSAYENYVTEQFMRQTAK